MMILGIAIILSAVLRSSSAQEKIGGCVLVSGDDSYVPSTGVYTITDPVSTTACDPFENVIVVYGLILTANSDPSTNNQNVTDDMMKWIAQTFTELFPPTVSNLTAQENVLRAMYTYKAANPVFSPTFVDDMEPARDYLSMCDTITVGNPEYDANGQIMEIYEHLLHIVSGVGLNYAFPSKWGISDTSSDLYEAMTEAIDASIYNVSSYAFIDDEARTRIQLQEFAYWALSTVYGVHETYFIGSAAPEWTLTHADEVHTRLPLFSALHNTTTATLMAAPSTATMISLGTLVPSATSDTPTWPIVTPGRTNANAATSTSACGNIDTSAISAPSSPSILVVGDSMGEFSGSSLETFCGGATVYNAAIGGTSAAQWATYDVTKIGSCGTTFDKVWIAIGGNDFLTPACGSNATPDVATLKATIVDGINNIKGFVPGSPDYLVTGYCVPSASYGYCTTAESYVNLRDALKEAAEETNVTYIDSVSACDGSNTTFSDANWFEDTVHLNNQGFCNFFTRSEVQTFFGCSSSSYSCRSVSCEVEYGTNCGDGTATSCGSCEGSCTVIPSPSPTPTDSSSSSDDTVVFVGAGVAVGIVLLLAVVGVYFSFCRRGAKKGDAAGGNDFPAL